MKCKSILAVLAAATVFAACSKENSNPVDGEPVAVSVQIIKGEPATRAEGTELTANQALSLNDGFLYFVDGGSGSITNRVTINPAGTPGDNQNSVEITDLTKTGGQAIANIKSNATEIYFLGNIPSAVAASLPSSGQISNVLSTTVAITSQVETTNWGVENVTVYGKGTVSTATNPGTASVTVNAITARLQIPFLKADGVITGFQLDGIFVNNFYHSMRLDGTPANSNLVAYTDNNTFAPDHASTPYYATTPYEYITFDWENSVGLGDFDLTNTDEYYPLTANNIWTYNVFGGGEVARIIFVFSNITTSDGSVYTNPQYVTVKGYTNDATSAPVTSLEGGKTYTFAGGITVDEDNLSSKPEVQAVSVEVQVTMTPWDDVPVTPEF